MKGRGLYSAQSSSHGLVDIGYHLDQFPEIHVSGFDVDWGYLGMPNISKFNVIRQSYIADFAVDGRLYWMGQRSVDSAEDAYYGTKPYQRPYDELTDLRNYSSPLASLGRRSLETTTFYRQHAVRHLSTEGPLTPTHPALYSTYLYTEQPLGDFTHQILKYKETDDPLDRLVAGGFVSGFPFPFSVGRETIPTVERIDVLYDKWGNKNKPLQSYASEMPYVGRSGTLHTDDLAIYGSFNGPNGWHYGDRVWSVQDRSIDFSNIVWYPNYYARYIRARMAITVEDLMPVPGEYARGCPLKRITQHIYGNAWVLQQDFPDTQGLVGPDGLANWRTIGGYVVDYSVSITPQPFPLSIPYTQRISSRSMRDKGKNIAEGRFNEIRMEAADIRPSCMVSSAAAMATLRETDTNYVEVLAEFGEIFALLPSIIGLIQKFRQARVLSRLGKLATLADLFSSANLLTQFGLKPTAKNYHDIKDVVSRAGNLLRPLQAAQTVKGKASFDLSHRIGPMQLVTRSSVRVNGLSDDLVAKFMGLDALGLAPLTSNLWDVVPWSWFLDYFLNLAKKLDVIDGFLLGTLRGVQYSVHSYTLYDQAIEDLVSTGIQPGEVKFTHYFREVSRYYPALFGGKYDFTNGSGANLGITASILWQLFR